ncbi:MAG: hypothetical protein HXY23_14220, partial [Parvularculaceae bacterium]|nr:hypothetical protein [Parvularculaceae bacterium]
MRRYQLVAIVGVLFLVAGMALLAQPRALAQDSGTAEEPPYLAEYYLAWVESPHADATAEAFTHWDEEAEKVIPESCAQCHSTPGYRDYLGQDGSAFGVVDAPAPLYGFLAE